MQVGATFWRSSAADLGLNNKTCFLLLALFKTGYLFLIIGVVTLFPRPRNSEMGSVPHIQWTPGDHPTLESYFTTWDAGHYLYLSEHGYQAGKDSCAFYPLWPLLIRGFSVITAGDHIIAGMLLTNMFSLVAALIFFRSVATRYGEAAGWWSVVFLFLFPGSLFFQFIYSESLFFLLLILLWFGLENDRFGIAFAAALLLPLTRAIGVFCVFPIFFHLILHSPCPDWLTGGPKRWYKRLFKNEASASSENAVKQPTVKDWFLIAAPFWGWAIYFILMWHWTNNPFEGFDAQRYWGVQSIGNLFNVPKFIIALFTPSVWHGFVGSLLDRCSFLLLLYCFPVIWRLDKALVVWAVVLGVVPAMSGDFVSFIRFASVVFPMFIAMAAWLGKPERKKLLFLTIACFSALHLVLLWRFIFFQWAG